jgi:hypothetical protein
MACYGGWRWDGIRWRETPARRSDTRGLARWTNRVIISFTVVRMLADCVGAAKYCDISIVLGIALEPMRRLHRIVASAYRIYQTQSPSLRVYVKEFMTLLVKSQVCRKQLGHVIFETQKDRNLAPVKRALATVEILRPRLNQQSQ